jgi:hypothetical protein
MKIASAWDVSMAMNGAPAGLGIALFNTDAWCFTDYGYNWPATGTLNLFLDFLAFAGGPGLKSIWLSTAFGTYLTELDIFSIGVAGAGHTLTYYVNTPSNIPADESFDVLFLTSAMNGIPLKDGPGTNAERQCAWLWDYLHLQNKAIYVLPNGTDTDSLLASCGLQRTAASRWLGHYGPGDPADIYPAGYSVDVEDVFDGVQPGGYMFCSDDDDLALLDDPTDGVVEVVDTTDDVTSYPTIALWRATA